MRRAWIMRVFRHCIPKRGFSKRCCRSLRDTREPESLIWGSKDQKRKHLFWKSCINTVAMIREYVTRRAKMKLPTTSRRRFRFSDAKSIEFRWNCDWMSIDVLLNFDSWSNFSFTMCYLWVYVWDLFLLSAASLWALDHLVPSVCTPMESLSPGGTEPTLKGGRTYSKRRCDRNHGLAASQPISIDHREICQNPAGWFLNADF